MTGQEEVIRHPVSCALHTICHMVFSTDGKRRLIYYV